MTSVNLKKLYAVVPGFKHDKDDDWVHYLPIPDQTTVRKCREKFVVDKDKLDELKLELRENRDPSSLAHATLGHRVTKASKDLDTLVKEVLLVKLPSLKARAQAAQERLIERDFNPSARNRAGPSSSASLEQPVSGLEFAAMASSFDAFLPSHILPASEPEPPPAEPTEQPQAEKPAKPARKPRATRDTYLDGVEEKNVDIMRKMRPLVEKLDCRDRVLAALIAIRKRDDQMDILDSILKNFPMQDGAKN